MAQARLAVVYPPPQDALLPYLGVVSHEDGALQAMAFDTEEKAQQFVHDVVLEDIHPALKSLWDLENELRSASYLRVDRNSLSKLLMAHVRISQ